MFSRIHLKETHQPVVLAPLSIKQRLLLDVAMLDTCLDSLVLKKGIDMVAHTVLLSMLRANKHSVLVRALGESPPWT